MSENNNQDNLETAAMPIVNDQQVTEAINIGGSDSTTVFETPVPNQVPHDGYSAQTQWAGSTATHAPQPAMVSEATPVERKGGPRASTIIWGLIIVLLGVALLLAVLGFTFDIQLFTIVLLGAAGVGLVASAIGKSLKR